MSQKIQYTNELFSVSNELSNLHWLHLNYNCEKVRTAFLHKGKVYKMKIKETKLSYYSNKMNAVPNKTKETWKIISERLGKNKKSRRYYELQCGDALVTDEQLIADKFAILVPCKLLIHLVVCAITPYSP